MGKLTLNNYTTFRDKFTRKIYASADFNGGVLNYTDVTSHARYTKFTPRTCKYVYEVRFVKQLSLYTP